MFMEPHNKLGAGCPGQSGTALSQRSSQDSKDSQSEGICEEKNVIMVYVTDVIKKQFYPLKCAE